MPSRLTALLLAGGLAGALAAAPATAASAATDTVMLREAEFNLRTDQLAVVAADTDTSAVLTVSVTATGFVIGTLTNYHSPADPTDVQAGVFKVIVNGQVTHPAEITVTSSAGSQASTAVSSYIPAGY